MYRVILPFMIFHLISFVFAESATQTDWSGGSGNPGPTMEWSDQFCSSSGITPTDPGSVMLGTSMKDYNDHFICSGDMLIRYAIACDVNGDGYTDVAYSNYPHDSIFWAENIDGSGELWNFHSFPSPLSSEICCLDPVDLDSDGDTDFLIAIGNDFYYLENLDGTGESWLEYPVAIGFDWAWRIIHVDIDEDGDLDAIGCAKGNGDVIISENVDGIGHDWSILYQTSYFRYPSWLGTADTDGDGDVDIFSGDGLYPPMRTGWIEQIDKDTWETHLISVWNNVDAGLPYDWDLDGDIDLLAGYTGPDRSLMLFLNTDGSGNDWEWVEIFALPAAPYPTISMDIDGDGDMDALGYEKYPHTLVWYENISGNASVWTRHSFWSAPQGIGCWSAADIDEDDYPDLVARWATTSYDTQLYWVEFLGPSLEGWLESSILYIGYDPDWGNIDWTADVPAGCSVAFQIRSSDDPEEMGSWSDTLVTPCSLEGILNDYDSYVQYKTILQTSDPEIIPVLFDVTLTWDPLGIEEDESAAFLLLSFAPNPFAGSPIIRFSLPEPSYVELNVFDITGRMVGEIQSDLYSQGNHDIHLEYLSPGIYFCRMISGDFTATQRFVVIQ